MDTTPALCSKRNETNHTMVKVCLMNIGNISAYVLTGTSNQLHVLFIFMRLYITKIMFVLKAKGVHI